MMDDGEFVSNIRGALVGAMVSGGFGVAWSVWGASGLSGVASTVVRIAGMVVGVLMILCCVYLWRRAPARGSGSGTIFSSGAYRLIVALETLALICGNLLLGVIGHREYIIAWVATVVGIHFLGFGRQFWVGFYRLGAALIAAGIVGSIVGLVGGSAGAIKATAGLIAAASLFVAGGSTIASARSAHTPDRAGEPRSEASKAAAATMTILPNPPSDPETHTSLCVRFESCAGGPDDRQTEGDHT